VKCYVQYWYLTWRPTQCMELVVVAIMEVDTRDDRGRATQECDDSHYGGAVAIVLVVVYVPAKHRLTRLRLEEDVRACQRNTTTPCLAYWHHI
jgi:hypothetical protein